MYPPLRHFIAPIILCLSCIAFCPAAEATPRDNDTTRLSELVVEARRPLKEAGMERTTFDSISLKENIALSMADVLTFNSSVFVKSYGRATLSTVAFRGTSPSHTQVTWNGMRVNSPMLGMTDFSTIPSYFIDKASLLHGSSSVADIGGGLGGSVRLATAPARDRGWRVQYVQGIGSFSTFDEFARIAWGNDRLKFSTRVVYSSSANDYSYINHDKKVNIYDDNHQIVGRYHPKERNRSGAFRDFHVLQEIYAFLDGGNRLGLNVWYTGSNRELPLLTVDYADATEFDNRQRESTLRSVASWHLSASPWQIDARAGWIHTWMGYDYSRESAPGVWKQMTRSRSLVNSLFGQGDAEWNPRENLLISLSATFYQHMIESRDNNTVSTVGDKKIIGYKTSRSELSGAASVKWQPTEIIGTGFTLREEIIGNDVTAPIPAIFADMVVLPAANLTLRASASRNYRQPSLNDLYFIPGGNPDLRPEKGWSYDAGISASTASSSSWQIGGGMTWFDSRISDWILWLPTVKGFFSPRNVKDVHAYGIEVKGNFEATLPHGWKLDTKAQYSWTPSVNVGAPMSEADKSVGRQLPYVPRHSASATGRLEWKGWGLLYKWCWYSRRFTMSSNDNTLSGRLPQYFMNNISIEKSIQLHRVGLQLRVAVNNLFNEDYLSVLSRPMPGINGEFFISLTWH